MTENSQGVDPGEGDVPSSTASDERELARYETIVDTVGDGVYQLDLSGRFVAVNDIITEVTGYDREELLGEHVSLLLDEEDIDTVAADIQDLLATDQNGVRTQELTVHTADGSTLPAEVRFSLLMTDTEVTGTVGVVRDISHRQERERAYRRERDLVERIFEAVSVSVAVVKEDGEIVRANVRARERLGIKMRDGEHYAVGDRDIYDADGEFVPPDDRPYMQVFETGESVRDWECQIELPDQGRRWFSITAIPLRADWAENGIERVVVTADDVTRIKRQSQQLRRQRDELASELDEIFERMDDAFYAVDEEFHFTYVNDRAEELLQHAEEELLGRRVWEMFPEAKETPAWESFHEALETQEPTSYEVYFDSLGFWVEATVYPSETGLSVYFRDVTERKEREQELERYETIVETVNDGIYTVDEDGHFTFVNEAYADLLGYDPEELLGEHVSLVVSNETIEHAQAVEQRLRTGAIDTATIETEVLTADEESVPAEGTFALLPPEAGNERVGVVRDITERKRREQHLRQERDRFTALFESVPEAVVHVRFEDGEPIIQTVNSEFKDVFGYPREELAGASLNEYIVPEEFEEEAARMDATTASLERIEREVIRQTIDGEREFLFRGVPFESEGEGVEGVGVYIDITERKQRERELERYETLVEESADVNAILDPDGTFRHLTPSVEHVLGYEPADLVGENVFEYIHPEDREKMMERFAETVDEVEDRPVAESRVRHADGEWRWLEARGRNLLDNPQIEGIVAYTRDITERKERERELEQSEQRYRTLGEHFPNGMVALFNEDLEYTLVGGRLYEQFGIDSAELEGGPVGAAIGDAEVQERVKAGYRRAFEGETSEFEVEWDDRVLWVQVIPVTDDDGTVFAGMVMSQDITNRKERERELERQREQLAALNELNGVVRKITDTVIERSTRTEVEQVVCAQLAASESYEFAWIGEVEPHGDAVRVRTAAGMEGYFDEIDLSIDPDDRAGRGPTAQAFRTGEMQVVQDAFENPDYEPWRARAAEYGFRASAAIPIAYEGTLYGVLNVYADRSNAFNEAEREVVSQLGEIVGHAINAIERKQALMSDEIVELEFHIQNVLDEFGIPDPEEGRITFDRAVPLGDDEFLEFGTATGDAIETLETLVDVVPHFADLTILSEGANEMSYELSLDEPPVLSAIAAHGGRVQQAMIEDGDYRMTIKVPPSVGVRRIADIVQDVYAGAEVVVQRQTTRHDQSSERIRNVLTEELTDRQRTALETAYYAGFFDWPRQSTGEEIAEAMDVVPATFHQHLRAGQNKLLGALFTDDPATA